MYDYVYICTWSMVLHKYSRPRHVYWSCCARKFSKCPFCVDIEGTWRRWWRKLTGSIITSCHMSLLTADLVTRLFSTGDTRHWALNAAISSLQFYTHHPLTYTAIQHYCLFSYSPLWLFSPLPSTPSPSPLTPSPLCWYHAVFTLDFTQLQSIERSKRDAQFSVEVRKRSILLKKINKKLLQQLSTWHALPMDYTVHLAWLMG